MTTPRFTINTSNTRKHVPRSSVTLMKILPLPGEMQRHKHFEYGVSQPLKASRGPLTERTLELAGRRQMEAGQARASHGSRLPQTPSRAAFLLQPQPPAHEKFKFVLVLLNPAQGGGNLCVGG